MSSRSRSLAGNGCVVSKTESPPPSGVSVTGVAVGRGEAFGSVKVMKGRP